MKSTVKVTLSMNTYHPIFAAYTVSVDEEFNTETVVYADEDCTDVFFDHILSEQRRIACILNRDYDMLPVTRSEQAEFDAATRLLR
jgi:hypothetical protein